MSLDICELIDDWESPADSVAARELTGFDGAKLLQLRVELGVLQMFREGRPDGDRPHGMPSVLEFVEHELRLGSQPRTATWDELRREIQQFNYRRVAEAAIAEKAIQAQSAEQATYTVERCADDITFCLRGLCLLNEHCKGGAGQLAAMIPNLVFHRARLRTRLRCCQQRFDQAIEEAETGARELCIVLEAAGFDESIRARDPGVTFLRDLAARIRKEHDVRDELRERLQAAIDAEDFEAAARLRDELRRRGAEGGASSDAASEPGGEDE